MDYRLDFFLLRAILLTFKKFINVYFNKNDNKHISKFFSSHDL